MNSIKVSIVMPVYNVEKYLRKTLESIVMQTLEDFEVILVDDGSKDGSKDICDEYCAVDKRFRLISQDNLGTAIARNNGLKEAGGEYIIFLDSDDVFEYTFLELMYDEAKKNDADVAVCGYNKINEENGVISTILPNDTAEKVNEYYLTKCFTSPWTKLCKLSFLKNNNILFQNLTSSNDVYYSICVLIEAKKIVYVMEALVNYRTGITNQISANRDPRNLGIACKCAQERYSRAEDYMIRNQIMMLCISNMKYECSCCCDEKKNNELYDCIKYTIINKDDCNHIGDKKINNLIKIIEEKEYSAQLVSNLLSFENQMEISKDEILGKIANHNRIVLWGKGMRGEAFLKFCDNNNISVFAIADKKNINIGEKNIRGYVVVHTDDVFNIADIVIASNNEIYEQLKVRNTNIDLLNLEQYIF